MEAARSNEQDDKIFAVVIGLIVWVLSFFCSVFALDIYLGPSYSTDHDFGLYLGVIFAAAVSLAFLAVVLWVRMVNRKHGPVFKDLSAWTAALSRSLDREIRNDTGKDDENTVELILRG